MKTLLKWLVLALSVAATTAHGAQCSATSGARRLPLLELYTSQGCDSCPPTDRWVGGLGARGLGKDRVVTLAFHVDYWNHLGWMDPYARSEYSERQRATARRNSARFVYTPQLLLNGKDYRRGLMREDFADRVAAINRGEPAAAITLNLDSGPGEPITATAESILQQRSDRPGASAYLALYENRLVTQVLAGENRGRRLEHDFVVRELAGPFHPDPRGIARFTHSFPVSQKWKRDDLAVAAFVQDERSGDVLQALVLGLCRS